MWPSLHDNQSTINTRWKNSHSKQIIVDSDSSITYTSTSNSNCTSMINKNNPFTLTTEPTVPTYNKSMDTIEKLLSPAIEHNKKINNMTTDEKMDYIKKKYNLTHGKGIRKRRKK